MHKININGLLEREMIDLNHKIVERLRFLQQMRDHGAMLEFSIGDRVAFDPPGRPATTGVLVKYNKELKVAVMPPNSRSRMNASAEMRASN